MRVISESSYAAIMRRSREIDLLASSLLECGDRTAHAFLTKQTSTLRISLEQATSSPMLNTVAELLVGILSNDLDSTDTDKARASHDELDRIIQQDKRHAAAI